MDESTAIDGGDGFYKEYRKVKREVFGLRHLHNVRHSKM